MASTIMIIGILMVLCIYAARLLIIRLMLSRKTSRREASIVSVMVPLIEKGILGGLYGTIFRSFGAAGNEKGAPLGDNSVAGTDIPDTAENGKISDIQKP